MVVEVGIYIYTSSSCLEIWCFALFFRTYRALCWKNIDIFMSHVSLLTALSTVCPDTLHCPAMSSNSNPPPSCWTVDWTPRLSSTSCPSPLFTGETQPSAPLPWIYQLTVWQHFPFLWVMMIDFSPSHFSPRLSKLPGWVSKDGAINLEKVRGIGQAYLALYVLFLDVPILKFLW